MCAVYHPLIAWENQQESLLTDITVSLKKSALFSSVVNPGMPGSSMEYTSPGVVINNPPQDADYRGIVGITELPMSSTISLQFLFFNLHNVSMDYYLPTMFAS